MLITLASLVLAAAPPQVCRDLEGSRCVAAQPLLRAEGQRGAADTLGRGAWLIDEENDEVLLANEAGVQRRVKVGAWPEQLVVDSSGRVFVSCRQAGRIDVIGVDFRVASFPIGPEPRALALDEAAGRLYVATVTGRQLVSFDVNTLEPKAVRSLALAPMALAVTPLGIAVASDRASLVRFVPASLEGDEVSSELPSAQPQLFGFGWGGEEGFGKAVVRPQWLVTRGDDLFVVSRSVSTGTDAPSSGGGYGGGISSPHQLVVHAFFRLSEGLPPAAAGVAIPLPDVSAVALVGSELTLASRTRGLLASINVERSTGFPALLFGLSDSGPASAPSRRPARLASFARGSLMSRGAVAIAPLEAGRLLIAEAATRMLSASESRLVPHSDSGLGVLGTGGGFGFEGQFSVRRTFVSHRVGPLPESNLDPELRLGRALFHDAENPRLTLRQLSCANCHPDGREDGLVWEQKATFRQTPMLAGGRLHETAPFNWLGSAKSLEANLTQTVTKRLQGTGLSAAELQALTRYVREGLRPVQRPEARDPSLVSRGRELFVSAETGCSTCHPADFSFTDGERHDVHSVSRQERVTFDTAHGESAPFKGFSPRFLKKIGRRAPELLPRSFNTPALAFVGLTAPYMHDGAARTLDELIEKNADRMGSTSQLGAEERRALVAYLESL